MNLNNSHGTRCRNTLDVTDGWGYNPEELLEEFKQLKIGCKLEAIEESGRSAWL